MMHGLKQDVSKRFWREQTGIIVPDALLDMQNSAIDSITK